MARHRRHRRYGSVVALPSLSELPLVGESVKVSDAIVGGILGFVAAAALKAGVRKFAPSVAAQIEGTAGRFLPVVAGAGAAAVLYYGEDKLLKMGRSRAIGHASGALLSGLALTAWDLLKQYGPGIGLPFDEAVQVRLGGVLINDSSDGKALSGVLITDHSDNLAELAAMSMGADDADDVMEMVGVE